MTTEHLPADSGSGRKPRIGDEVELEIGAVAHGGHCVARWDTRVVFVRHALPGERARVRLTDVSHAGYFRADAIAILRPDARRVTPRCGHFRPGGCGGCDFQHADPVRQLELKAAVVAEQLSRIAGIERQVQVEALPGRVDGDAGYGWRTRVRWALDADGRIGPRAARSHQVVGISVAAPCEIAAPGLTELATVLEVPERVRRLRGGGHRKLPEVTLTHAADGAPIAVWAGAGAEVPLITETVAGRDFSVAADGFWQVHPEAAAVLYAAVGEAFDGVELTGGTAWDLYGGVGLFAAELADRVGPTGAVLTVEGDATATESAAANLADLPQVRAVNGRVEQVLDELADRVDAVVLDPPRSGAGRAVCVALAARQPSVIVYVACDPAALARDTAALAEAGYRLDTLRAFDCFPQTHHIECVARFVPDPSSR
ncbi:class I SAM-dependent RNA methyltransferase [Nakamurella lactea]|uniref:class I SAM-dependent RNA methyltransferase n=1 Tax=Nakamurella lactea TaxID=459515 RepID=UPI0003F85E44|nr:TRAM domain-containing protein [Nakamurella lactea]